MNDYYITSTDYDLAANNGISAKTLEQRVRQYGWSKKRAINTPVQASNKTWIKIAEQNGISKTTFFKRVYSLKWSKDRAATTPIQICVDDKWRKIAASNGISANTLSQRINRYGWDIEKAATCPIIPHGERNKIRRVEEA